MKKDIVRIEMMEQTNEMDMVAETEDGKPLRCPECMGPLFPESGCFYCPVCGYSRC